MTDPIRARLQADVPASMKARDALRVSVLRTTLAAIANAEAVDAAHSRPAAGLHSNEATRRHLTEDEIVAIVTEIRDELRDSAREMDGLGQAEVAAEKAHQAGILDAYLHA